jgi:hypothetical protein
MSTIGFAPCLEGGDAEGNGCVLVFRFGNHVRRIGRISVVSQDLSSVKGLVGSRAHPIIHHTPSGTSVSAASMLDV